jgi:hypothetical protein
MADGRAGMTKRAVKSAAISNTNNATSPDDFRNLFERQYHLVCARRNTQIQLSESGEEMTTWCKEILLYSIYWHRKGDN